MKRFKCLIVAIAILPFVLYGAKNDLPYDYVESNVVKSKPVKKVRKKLISTKKLNAPKLDYRKEPSGTIFGVGGNVAWCLLCTYGAKSYNNGGYYNGYNYSEEWYRFMGGADILIGHKWFFGKGGFGMRLYANYSGLYISGFQAHNVGVNYDLLFNWVKTKPFKFGMILGIQNGITLESYKVCSVCLKTFVSTAGNIGFRFVIYDKYAIEILAQPRIGINLSINDINESDNLYYDIGSFINAYAIGNLRFVYTF